jgi:hypothetical protein
MTLRTHNRFTQTAVSAGPRQHPGPLPRQQRARRSSIDYRPQAQVRADAERAIASSPAPESAFDPDTRFEAAARLAEVDEAQAAEALRSIMADDAFDADTRSEAAARLAEVGG